MGAGGGETRCGTGRDCTREAGWNPHAAPQLRPSPADEQDSHQLSVTLAGALVNTDDTDLLGASAGPVGEIGGSAVTYLTD